MNLYVSLRRVVPAGVLTPSKKGTRRPIATELVRENCFTTFIIAVLLLMGAGATRAQILAHDDAAAYATINAWGSGMNLGFGFLPWGISSSGPVQPAVFVGDGGNIATASNSAWALHAYGTPLTNLVVAFRGFSNSLAIGQSFRLQWRAGDIGYSNYNFAGFGLCTANNSISTTSDYTNGERFSFFYRRGGPVTNAQDDAFIRDGSGESYAPAPGVAFGSIHQGITLEFTLLSSNTYRLAIRDAISTNVIALYDNRPLAGAGPLQSVAFYDSQTDGSGGEYDGNQMFNNMEIVAPSGLSLNCSSNRTVECGASWTFDTPSASTSCGDTNVSISVLSTVTNALCGSTFAATQTWQATDNCSNTATCSQTITVVDTTPPVFTGISNLVVECGSVWTFIAPTASDSCSGTNVNLVVKDTSTNQLCGGTFSATRSWLAMDGCSNSAFFTQTVSVVDTTPPVLTCASNRFVECGTAWTFDPPSAIDLCSGTNVTITVLGTTTNPLVGTTFSATRTWQASDACSNIISCSQTVNILDTIPPQIFCSSNLVAECAGPGGTPVFFSTTAVDTCDPHPTVVCTPQSGSLFSLGTNTVVCVATDASGNSNVCSFQVVVQDTTPPQISCPTNMNVAEAPRDSGFATVTFSCPVATDTCDAAPLVSCNPPSGSVFPVGTNIVTCTAVDHTGNTNSCTFTIRVIPYRLRVIVSSPADSGPGTLRQALLDANDSPDANLVLFNLPGPPPYIIHLLSALPAQTSPAFIDGWSQGGSNGPPVIELDGSTASNAIDGLVLQAGNNTVRGLALHGFNTAIRLESNGSNVVQGNFIGTDVTGTNGPGNAVDGIYVNTPRNLIGGTGVGTGNIISANARNGIHLESAGASNNVVQGNFIGLAADGASPLGNGGDGILLTNQPSRSLIGGATNGVGNAIAFNGRSGIASSPDAGLRNRFVGNNVFSNSVLGIDLGDDGIPNGFPSFPVLTDAQSINGTLTIYGYLTNTLSGIYYVEFFLNDYASPSGYGEGQRFIGSALITVSGSGFAVPLQVPANATQFVTATATDPAGNTSEFSQALRVRTPPVIAVQPVSTNAPIGSPVTFVAAASGTGPFTWQWRLNGFNIPGATNSTYTISAAEFALGGTYSVIVQNALGAISTLPVSLTLPVTNVAASDNFSNATVISGISNRIGGNNFIATLEPGEPLHAGKHGGSSVWYTWTAPVRGVAEFTTSGSTFDTLLAIYTGTNVAYLTNVASDENHGGFYTSKARFNVQNGVQYAIAIDGLGGAQGNFILGWQVSDDPHLLPVFLIQPQSQTVGPGSNAVLAAVAVRVCGYGHENCPNPDHYPEGTLPGLFYQWNFYGSMIPGATSNVFTVTNVQPPEVGNYRLQVSTLWQTNESTEANLQINLSGNAIVQNVQAENKFLDLVLTDPLLIGDFLGGPVTLGHTPRDASGSVVRGFTGTQIFNTTGNGSTPGEVICGVIGGASEWITIVPAASGTLFVNTDGSTYDTVMAVFRRSPTNASVLQLLACDNNSGSNGLTSAVTVPVVAGQTNYIEVDGVNGVSGVLQLNYSLITTAIIKSAGLTPQGPRVELSGRTNLHFTLQASSNLLNWSPLITATATNGIFDYIDTNATDLPRYYRAVLLP